jgi:hypothetical protein
MGFRLRYSNSKSKILPQPISIYVGRYSRGPSLKRNALIGTATFDALSNKKTIFDFTRTMVECR